MLSTASLSIIQIIRLRSFYRPHHRRSETELQAGYVIYQLFIVCRCMVVLCWRKYSLNPMGCHIGLSYGNGSKFGNIGIISVDTSGGNCCGLHFCRPQEVKQVPGSAVESIKILPSAGLAGRLIRKCRQTSKADGSGLVGGALIIRQIQFWRRTGSGGSPYRSGRQPFRH